MECQMGSRTQPQRILHSPALGLRLLYGDRILCRPGTHQWHARPKTRSVQGFQRWLICGRTLSVAERFAKVPRGTALDLEQEPVCGYAPASRSENTVVARFELGHEGSE